MSWQHFLDSSISAPCREEHEVASSIKELIGTQLVFINSNIASAADEESLAEILSTYANTVIRSASKKVTDFAESIKERSSRDVINPLSERMH